MAMVFRRRNNRDTVEFTGVKIIHRNFAGAQKEFNRAGNRGFSVVVTPDEAEELLDRGYNVRIRPSQENPDEKFCFLPVTVNYNNIPPKIYRVVGDKLTLLTGSNVGVLDTSDIINVDLTINARYWEINGKNGIKAYANVMYVEVEEDAFADKYSHMTFA